MFLILVGTIAAYVALIGVEAPGSCGAQTGGPCGPARSAAVVGCSSADYVTPDWQNPSGGARRVSSVRRARRVSGLPLVAPVRLGTPHTIYAQKRATWFVFHGPRTGDVIVVEARPQLSAHEWRRFLTAAVGANGKPGTVGTASIARLAPEVQALQTVSPCLSGSTTDWRTQDGRLDVTIEAHTMTAPRALVAARLMNP